jgi:hypothetical protein
MRRGAGGCFGSGGVGIGMPTAVFDGGRAGIGAGAAGSGGRVIGGMGIVGPAAGGAGMPGGGGSLLM